MKLPLILKSFDELPETLRPVAEQFYVKMPDGTFALDGDEDTTALKSALQSERKLRSDFEKKAKIFEPFEQAGLTDFTAVAAKLQKHDELIKLDPKKDAEKIAESKIQAITLQFNEQLNKVKVDADERDAKRLKQLADIKIKKEGVEAINKHGASLRLLMPTIEKNTRMVQNQAGEIEVEVIDENGLARLGKGTAKMTVAEYVDELKSDPECAGAFPASKKGGSGAQGSGSGNSPTGKIRISRNDQAALSANFDKIAKNEVEYID